VRALLHGEAETQGYGARLARSRPEDGELAVVFLTGGLGAGKTTLARGFLGALGVTDSVRSPTYTLVELYRMPRLTVLHCDLYRLRGPAELEDLGLREWAAPGYLWLVEWPERGGGLLPRPDLTATLAVLPGAHSLELVASTPRGEAWLGRLRTA